MRNILLTLAFFCVGLTVVPAQNDTDNFAVFQSTPVSSVLDTYAKLSGKHLILDSTLSAANPVSLDATGLSREQTLRLIESTLLLNGVAFVPVDADTLKVVAVSSKNPRSEGLRIYANTAELPTDDRVVTYFMPLNYADPKDVSSYFTLVAPPHQYYGSYVPVPASQALLLTENASVIRELVALRDLVDTPPAAVVTEFIDLRRSDPEKVAEIVNTMLNPKNSSNGGGASASGTATNRPAGAESTSLAPNEHSLIAGSAQVLPDERSNRLLVVTRPINLPFLRRVIAELDSSSDFMAPQRRALKYVLAQNILPALEAALAQGKDEESQVAKGASGTSASSTTSGTNGAASPAGAASNTTTSGSGTGSSATGLSAITPELSAPADNSIPSVVIIGKTRILADNRSNSIIVFGTAGMADRVFKMIDELDRKPLQLYLATVIGQLTLTDEIQFGIDFLQNFQQVGQGGFSTSLVTPNTAAGGAGLVPNARALTSSAAFPLVSGLTLYGAIGSTLNAYLRALENTNRFKIISRPSVYTENNKLAVIASGSQVPVPSNTTSGFTGSSTTLTTTSSIAYENVLLQLDIVPLINADRQITLKIRQTNNTLGANVEISGNAIPTINTQEINTEITVPDKSTIVIGGLISDQLTRDVSGIPFLSKIPLLGYLFSNTDKTKTRNELIIMIQPTVIGSDEDQIAANEAEKQKTILGAEAVAAATGTVSAEDPAKPFFPHLFHSNTLTNVPPRALPVSTGSAGLVPAASTPAPDVATGQVLKDTPPSVKAQEGSSP